MTMFWVVLICTCWIASAAKLNNEYLPPPNARLAGGSDDDLEAPLEAPYTDPYSDSGSLDNNPNSRSNVGRDDLSVNDPNAIEQDYPLRSSQGRSYDRNQGSNTRPYNQPNYRDGGRASTVRPGGVNNVQYNPYPEPSTPGYLQNQNRNKKGRETKPDKNEGKFISGSYSYKGPDNVLVTVTYSADDEEKEDGSRSGKKYKPTKPSKRPNVDDYEDGVVPTPASLPEELAKAFDFHSRKHKGQDENKESSSGYHYDKPSTVYGKPEINQGYSYPKPQGY